MPDPTSTPAAAPPAASAPAADAPPKAWMSGLVRSLIRPYRTWVLIVFAAMMVETLMSLAAPWPLKIVLDNALNHEKLPHWLEWVHDWGIDRNTMGLALFAALATLGKNASDLPAELSEQINTIKDARARLGLALPVGGAAQTSASQSASDKTPANFAAFKARR